MDMLLKDFEVEPRNTSEDASRKWRRAVTIVKNPRRRFRMVADLAKRAVVERKILSIQEWCLEMIIRLEELGHPEQKGQRRKRIEMAPLKSGWTGAISISAREQNNVDKAQQREPLFTGEFERANDLTREGIELPRDTPDDQDELKKLKGSKYRDLVDDFKSGWTLFTGEFEQANDLTGGGIELLPDTPDDQDELKKSKGSKSRDMVDDFKSGLTGAVSASAREQNTVDMAQQREPLLTGECEQAIDLTRGGIELPRDAPDDQDELKKSKGSKSRDMVDVLKSGWILLMTNLILEIASAVFDQLGYALVGMVLAFVALLVATADLIIHMAPEERTSLLPSYLRPSTTHSHGTKGKKSGGTIVEYFGLVGAVWQCVYSIVAYAYARQKKDNPIKMTLLPFIFLLCVAISKLIKTEFIDESA